MALTKSFYMGFVTTCILTLTGCINSNIIPDSSMPSTPRPALYPSTTSITASLDCLSRQLIDVSTPSKVVLNPINNAFTAQVGDMLLPLDLRGFVYQSLNRVSNGFAVYSEVIPNPQLIIEGNLLMAREARTAAIDAELLGIGAGSEIKAYDLTLSLRLFSATDGRVIATSTITNRIASGEEGLSAFLLQGDDYMRGSYKTIEHLPVRYGLQMLSDAATFQILRKFSALNYNTPLRNCMSHNIQQGVERPPDNSIVSLPLVLQMTRELNINGNGDGVSGYCISVNRTKGVKESFLHRPFKLFVSQYRNADILVGKNRMFEVPDLVHHNPFCIIDKYIDPQARDLEVSIEHGKNHILYGAVRQRLHN